MNNEDFEDVDFEIGLETLGMLYEVVYNKLALDLSPCSVSVIDRAEVSNCEELSTAIGKAYLNEVIVQSLTDLVEKQESVKTS